MTSRVFPKAIDILLVEDLPGGEHRLLRRSVIHVGGDEGRGRSLAAAGFAAVGVRTAQHLIEIIQAVIEFVIAQCGGIVLEVIHHLVDAKQIVTLHSRHQSLIVGHGGALDRVPVIDQQGVLELGTGTADQRRGALEADRQIICRLVIVVAEGIGMQIGCFENREIDLAVSFRRWRGGRGVIRTVAAAAA